MWFTDGTRATSTGLLQSIGSSEQGLKRGLPLVAFLGERGAYGEEAANRFFKEGLEVAPKRSLSLVFRSLEDGEVDCAVVPVENSLEGGVNETYDLLLRSEVKVCGELHLKITHNLLCLRGVKLKQIRRVYSHTQALAQCRMFIERHGFEPVPYRDTAGSALKIREENLRDAAAIASLEAARRYGLKVLARRIQDNPRNYTRFLLLSRKDTSPTGSDKTSLIFSTKHVPGALYSALEEFALRGINLAKIESRPTKETPWEYHFYLDFEGHRSDPSCKAAIQGLRRKSNFVKILGSYPQASSS